MMVQGGHVWRIDSAIKIVQTLYEFFVDENGKGCLKKILFFTKMHRQYHVLTCLKIVFL